MEENYVFSFKKLCIFLLKIHFEKKNMYLLKDSKVFWSITFILLCFLMSTMYLISTPSFIHSTHIYLASIMSCAWC